MKHLQISRNNPNDSSLSILLHTLRNFNSYFQPCGERLMFLPLFLSLVSNPILDRRERKRTHLLDKLSRKNILDFDFWSERWKGVLMSLKALKKLSRDQHFPWEQVCLSILEAMNLNLEDENLIKAFLDGLTMMRKKVCNCK